MSEHVEKEMKRLRKNILLQMPSNLFQNTPGGDENTPLKYWQFKKENGRYQR